MTRQELNDRVDAHLQEAGVDVEPRPAPKDKLVVVYVEKMERAATVLRCLHEAEEVYTAILAGKSRGGLKLLTNSGRIVSMSSEAALVALALDIRRLSDELEGLGFTPDHVKAEYERTTEHEKTAEYEKTAAWYSSMAASKLQAEMQAGIS